MSERYLTEVDRGFFFFAGWYISTLSVHSILFTTVIRTVAGAESNFSRRLWPVWPTFPMAPVRCLSELAAVHPVADQPHSLDKWTLIARLMGPIRGLIWGRQGPGGPHVGPMNLVIWGGYNGPESEDRGLNWGCAVDWHWNWGKDQSKQTLFCEYWCFWQGHPVCCLEFYIAPTLCASSPTHGGIVCAPKWP